MREFGIRDPWIIDDLAFEAPPPHSRVPHNGGRRFTINISLITIAQAHIVIIIMSSNRIIASTIISIRIHKITTISCMTHDIITITIIRWMSHCRWPRDLRLRHDGRSLPAPFLPVKVGSVDFLIEKGVLYFPLLFFRLDLLA